MYYNRILFLFLFIASFNTYAQNYPALFDQNSLNGTNGFIVYGLNAEDALGTELSFIGDINNDGLEDLAINTEQIEPNGLQLGGTTYVIFGSKKPYPSPFDLTTLNGTNGFIFEGSSEGERRGKTIGKLGDINGDGIDDVSFASQGKSHVFLYGKQGVFPAKIVFADINGTNGFVFEQSGIGEIRSAGDVNGDGIQDIVMGQIAWSGETYIIFGRTSNFPASITNAWLDGVKGFRLNKVDGSFSAYFTITAGDINADGFDDVLIGVWTGSTPADQLSYVYFGHAAPFDASVDLKAVTGTTGFSIRNEGNSFLVSTSPLGDINGDGIDDCFAGNKVIFGSSKVGAFYNDFVVNGTNGFLLPSYAYTPAAIGDVNFDGIDDFIVIAPNNAYWVVYGSKSPFPAIFDPAVLDGTKGFKINEVILSNIGRQMSGDADVNGDGKSDFMFGSPFTKKPSATGYSHGAVYIVFGGDHFAKPLTTTFPKVRSITATSFALDVNAQEKGVLYYGVYNGNQSSITNRTTILNGTGALQYGTIDLPTASSTKSKVLSGLAVNTKYDVYVYFKDEAGNVGEIYFLNDVTTLADIIAPVITCLTPQTVACGSTLANYKTLVTVTDNTDLNPVVTQTPAAGMPVVSGMLVTIKATDKYNNFSECKFTVTITNTVVCPSPTNVSTGSQLLDYTALATTTGFCNSVATITQSPLPGTLVTEDTQIILKATDADNATAACMFMLTVNGQTTPVLTSQLGNSQLVIYPNPAKELLYVKGYDYSSYEVINNLGGLVLQGGSDSEISLSGIENGIYMILFYTENGELVAMRKMIKE